MRLILIIKNEPNTPLQRILQNSNLEFTANIFSSNYWNQLDNSTNFFQFFPWLCKHFSARVCFYENTSRVEFVTEVYLISSMVKEWTNTLISSILCVCLTLCADHNGILYRHAPGAQERDGGNGALFFSCPVFLQSRLGGEI